MLQSSHCMTPFFSNFKNKISLVHSAFTCLTPGIVNTDFPEVNSQPATLKTATIAEVRTTIM